MMDYTSLTAVAATFIIAWTAGPPVQPVAAETRVDPGEELTIMAKVIEGSLDEAGLGSWKGVSAQIPGFGPVVKSQYIPTVGAIFTVSVTFLIAEPSAEAPQKMDPQGDTDLWEKFLKESGKAESGEERTAETPDNLDRLEDRLRTDELIFPSPGGPGLEYESPDMAKRFMDWFPEMTGRGPEYDEDKVARLHEVLVATLAKYGYRLSGVPAKERVIVIIEAPDAESTGAGSPDALSQSFAWIADQRRKSDRLFLGIDKSVLTEAASPEAVAKVVQVIRY